MLSRAAGSGRATGSKARFAEQIAEPAELFVVSLACLAQRRWRSSSRSQLHVAAGHGDCRRRPDEDCRTSQCVVGKAAPHAPAGNMTCESGGWPAWRILARHSGVTSLCVPSARFLVCVALLSQQTGTDEKYRVNMDAITVGHRGASRASCRVSYGFDSDGNDATRENLIDWSACDTQNLVSFGSLVALPPAPAKYVKAAITSTSLPAYAWIIAGAITSPGF